MNNTEIQSLKTAARKVETALAQADKAFAEAERAPVALLQKVVRGLGEALDSLPPSCLPLTRSRFNELEARVAEILSARSEVAPRRQALVELARAAGWDVVSTSVKDFVGPFTVEHAPSASTVKFGPYRLAKLELPAGAELMNTLKAQKQKLHDEALKGWDDFIRRALEAQGSVGFAETVPWPTLVAHAIPDPVARKRAAKALHYRVAMLISGQAPGGHRIQCVPPTLAEQRLALSVPRLDRANDETRIYRVRLR